MTTSKNRIKVASYNVNGVLNPTKRSKIVSKMKKEGVEVILLQETHLTEKEHAKLKRNGSNQIFSASYKSGHGRGGAILISGRISFEKISVTGNKEGRFIMVKGNLEGEVVTLVNVYAPPGSDRGFYRQMFDLMITGGHLNQRLNSQLDSSAGGIQKSAISKKIKDLMAELGVVDVWRDLNPTSKNYTYYSSPHNIYTRIDYFLMYNKDMYRVEKCEIGIMDLSDHCPLYLTLSLASEKKTTIWRLNSNILKGHMKEEIVKELQTYVEDNDNGEVGCM